MIGERAQEIWALLPFWGILDAIALSTLRPQAAERARVRVTRDDEFP